MLNFGKLIDLNLSNNDIQELNVFVGKLKWTLSLVSLYVCQGLTKFFVFVCFFVCRRNYIYSGA